MAKSKEEIEYSIRELQAHDDDATNKLEPEKMIGHKEGGVEDEDTSATIKQDAEGYYWIVKNGKIVGGPYTTREKAKLGGKSNVIVNDSDPKVAEAQAIINLCGGVL